MTQGHSTAPTLSLVALPGIPAIDAGTDLARLTLAGCQAGGLRLREGDIVVMAQKIVSKSEGRQVALGDVTPSPRALELAAQTGKDPRIVELILSESRHVLRVRPGLIIVEHRLGFVMANAGIDQSNIGQDGHVLLLPKDADASAAGIRRQLGAAIGLDLGVMIIDSIGRAWRNGAIGTAIGVAGFPALMDLRGEPDLYGRRLEVTQVAVADELACAASLLMGQGAEGRPIVVASGVPYARREGAVTELLRPLDEDLFR